MKSQWTTDFPTEVGTYWFYGYRYGKVSCGSATKPELMLVKVRKISNGTMMIAEGQFMDESEVECPHFCKAKLPELPSWIEMKEIG